MSSENIGLLCSRSRSQPVLHLSVKVSLDDIFWIVEPFVTKPGMVIRHYKPECHVHKMGRHLQGQSHSNWVGVSYENILLSLRSKPHSWPTQSTYDRFYYIFRNTETFAIKISLMVHHHKSFGEGRYIVALIMKYCIIIKARVKLAIEPTSFMNFWCLVTCDTQLTKLLSPCQFMSYLFTQEMSRTSFPNENIHNSHFDF